MPLCRVIRPPTVERGRSRGRLASGAVRGLSRQRKRGSHRVGEEMCAGLSPSYALDRPAAEHSDPFSLSQSESKTI